MGHQRVLTPYDDLTYKIIGCAMTVHRGLGAGYREDTYQRDLSVHLTYAGLTFEPQKRYEVHDSLEHGQLIGYYILDFIVEEKVIVEIKALTSLDSSHVAQMIGYMAVSRLSLGLLINFGQRSLQYKRIIPPKNIREHQVNRQGQFVPDWLKPDHKPET